ncbi:hypothetical protein VHEMI09195 [[Torrubiella] hemipterigena]|uniref:Major facilitator superfamily (MFS) profile domain-containing protein n=1 Tax=[Torrubiella] hemipterigena TaxID=1531966 RepID=A0A0A1TR35_9HYPO|nr:hypothetical protein VHEMI09195 [[Torrubiella] hemipterigena]
MAVKTASVPAGSEASSSTVVENANATENTPLLQSQVSSQDNADVEDGAPNDDEEEPKSYSKVQLALICYCRLMDPIGFFGIFPYIAAMVEENGNLEEVDSGNYTGAIESLFSIAQMCTLMYWGRMSDHSGRKPVLMISLVGSVIFPAMFGMSKSIWQMALTRFLAGCFSGAMLVCRTIIGDSFPPKTQASAYSWFAFSGNMGILLGPLIGGALAKPAEQYPNVFGHIAFFKTYPYALPGFAFSLICLVGAVACAFLLEETLPRKDATLPAQETAGSDSEDSHQSNASMTTWELLKYPGVSIAVWTYCHAALLGIIFPALLPLVLHMSVPHGGLGFSQFEITLYTASQGASQAFWLLIIFPPLQRRVTTKGVLRICAAFYPFFFPGYMLMNAMLRFHTPFTMAIFWVIAPITALVAPGIAMAFTGVQLSLNDASPSPFVLGSLNALTLTIVSGLRAVGPGLATVLYSYGARNDILWGQFGWVVMMPLAATFPVVVAMLPRSPAK